MNEPIHESTGNVFLDLGFPAEQAVVMRLHADLIEALRQTMEAKGRTQP